MLWENYNRILKPNGVVLMFAGEPFTSKVILSNIKQFKYRWTWMKNRPTGFLNAKLRPLKLVEDICVFGTPQSIYNPQGLIRVDRTCKNSMTVGGESMMPHKSILRGKEYKQEFTNYPKDVLCYGLDEKNKLHPTQKTLELCRYLVRTYSNEGDVVLDTFAGSGSIPLAAKLENRKYVGMELDETYFKIAETRLKGN